MTYIEVDQRSAGWFEARVGKITASRARSAMDFLKSGKEGADRKKLRRALAGERITGVPAQVFVTSAMQRGTDLEGSGGLAAAGTHHGQSQASRGPDLRSGGFAGRG